MSSAIAETVAERVLAMVPAGVDAQVRVESGVSALTRFANSFIHQNVADAGVEVSLTVARGKQVASATAHIDDGGIDRFVRSVVEAADVVPETADWPGLVGGDAVVGHAAQPGAAEVSADDRADVVAGFIGADPDLSASGYCRTDHADVVLMNTAGLVARGSSALAVVDGIHQTPTSAGSGHRASRCFADLDGADVGALAAQRARRSATPTEVAAGTYEVVLAPEAVATIALFLGFYGFNGKQVADGQSFVRLGEAQFDPAFELVDDGSRPDAPGVGFDTEGTAKRRVELVTDGTVRNLAVDRRQEARLGLDSTGHAATTFGSYLGPLLTDLCVGAGTTPPDELIAGVERGLYVATFNYCRVLDPMTTVTTGLTRNGTFVIEGGEIVGAASNLRFTQSFAAAVGPGNVVAVGNDARLADSELGAGFVHAPSMHLRSWRFTGGASG